MEDKDKERHSKMNTVQSKMEKVNDDAWEQEIIWKEEGRVWRDIWPKRSLGMGYRPVLHGLKFHSALGYSFSANEDLLKSCGDYIMIRLFIWVFFWLWQKKAGLRKGTQGEDNEVEGAELPGILLEHMPGVSFLFFLKDFPYFIQYSYFQFLLELIFLPSNHNFSFCFYDITCIPPTSTLCDPSAFCLSTSGTSVGEVFPKEAPQAFSPSMWYLLWLIWVSSCGHSAMRASGVASDHCPFGNPTSCFDSDRIKPASQLKMAFVPLWHFPLLGVTWKASDSGLSSTVWK